MSEMRLYKSEFDIEFLENYVPRLSDTSIYRATCSNCGTNDYVLPIRLGLVGPEHKENPNIPPKISYVDFDEGFNWDCTKCMVYFN